MSTPDPWTHFAEAFRHFDRGWAAADKVFENMPQGPGTERKLTASTWRSRWKLFCVFNRIAWRLLLRGKVTIKI